MAACVQPVGRPLRMADEALAADMFYTAWAWAREAGVHEELYALRIALKCLNACAHGPVPYLDSMKERTRWLTEVFPFYWVSNLSLDIMNWLVGHRLCGQ